MTKDEIKKVLALCIDTFTDRQDSCDICEYSDYHNCQDYLCRDALAIITDQEKEIEQLKSEIIKQDQAIIERNFELVELEDKIKQAKIDVLNELKKDCGSVGVIMLTDQDIDKIIEEFQK